MVFVFLDNGLLRKLIGPNNEHILEAWHNYRQKVGLKKSGTTTKYVITPFMLLEVIGVIPDPYKPSDATKNKINELSEDQSTDTEVIKKIVYDEALGYFSSLCQLTADKLKRKTREQKDYCSEKGRKVFDDMFQMAMSKPKFEEELHQKLAFDAIYKYEYPSAVQKKMVGSFSVDVFRGVDGDWDISQARAAVKAWLALRETMLKIYSLETVDKIQSQIMLKKKEDYLDTELVHFGVVGKNYNGDLFPVHCFTCDDDEKIKRRIGLFKDFLKPVQGMLSSLSQMDKAKLPFQAQEFQNGTIHVASSDGMKFSSFKVSSISSVDDEI